MVSLVLNNYFDILNIIGYSYSDKFLQTISGKIKQFLSINMFLYNPYDNKFVILIENNNKDIMDWIKRFHSYLSDSVDFIDIPIHLKTYMGIVFSSETIQSGDEILRTSFLALSNAIKLDVPYKKYDHNLHKDRLTNMRLLGEVKQAIRENQFVLYYQPKINIKSKKIIGAEVLIRWNHPKDGFVPPGDFIPQVEGTHLINPLSYWVLHQSIHDFIDMQKRDFDTKLAINLSAKSFQDTQFINTIKSVMKNHDLKATNFEFELTERDIMKDSSNTFKKIKELRDAGFSISIDDFGTGYSSLAYLNSLPADIIKIDRSFITNMAHDKQKRDITRATINMGHSLGKKLVAEGIENEEELILLEEMGCEYGQGYYTSKPLPLDKFLEFAKEYSNQF